jgi:hypothetical protein
LGGEWPAQSTKKDLRTCLLRHREIARRRKTAVGGGYQIPHYLSTFGVEAQIDMLLAFIMNAAFGYSNSLSFDHSTRVMSGLSPAHGPVLIIITNEEETPTVRLYVDKKAITQWARRIPVRFLGFLAVVEKDYVRQIRRLYSSQP